MRVLQVRFVPGKRTIAACGLTADNKGWIRIFDIAYGKQTFKIETPDPVIFIDFDRGGRYLAATGISHITVLDIVENQAVSLMPKDSPESRGVFFMEDRYVLQSDSLSLYDWKGGKKAGFLDAVHPLNLKKISDSLFVWTSANGLFMLHAPCGRREFIPYNARGVYAFDIAPDGRWGLFLKENQTMELIDCTTGATVREVGFKSRPDGVFINRDASSAYVLYKSEKSEVFDIGNENAFRNMKFYTTKFFTQVWNKTVALVKNSGVI